jgi:hypothetical protein
MSLEQIINNNENKIIFLRAILLGITYGKKENSDYYKENIEKEIENLNNLYQKDKNIKDVQNIQNVENIQKETINEYINNNLINNNLINNNNEQNIDKKILYKYSNILKNLENQKQYTINLIQTLSANHYGYNYSKINLLKTNLQFINNEIEKNKNLFKKDIMQKSMNIDKELNNPKYFNNLNKFNNNNIQNKINRISPAINFSAKNTNIIKKSNINNNLEKELEYTLDNLSRLLIN